MKEVISRGMTRIGQIIEVSKYDTPYYALQKQIENGLFIYFWFQSIFGKLNLLYDVLIMWCRAAISRF